jgi:hypothetical protein
MFTSLLALVAILADTAAAAPGALTAQQWALVLLAISTAGSFAYGYVQKRRSARTAKLVHAAFAGIKKGAADYAEHKDLWTAVEDAIYDAAADLNLPEEHVDAHIGDGLVPPPPPQKLPTV